MLPPDTRQALGVKKMQSVRPVRRGARSGKEPPAIIRLEQRRVDVIPPLEQCPRERPFLGEPGCPVEPDRIHRAALRHHVIVTVPLEDVRIGEMKGLGKNDSLVGPGFCIVADGEADLALLRLPVPDLEKHVPARPNPEQERVCHKIRRNVRDLCARHNRVHDTFRRCQMEGRIALVDSNRPRAPDFPCRRRGRSRAGTEQPLEKRQEPFS